MNKKVFLQVLFLVIVQVLNAQNNSPLTDSTLITKVVSEQYFQRYLNLDFDKMGELMDDDFSFEDPTANMLFGWNKPKGKENALQFFKNNYASIIEMKADQIRNIISGNHAIYEVQLHFKFYLNEEKDIINISMPLVTILVVKEGKISEHKDYGNYNDYMEQYRSQIKSKE